jgi:hypothetical protein
MDECKLCLTHQQNNLVKHAHEELGHFVVQLDLYFALNTILAARDTTSSSTKKNSMFGV